MRSIRWQRFDRAAGRPGWRPLPGPSRRQLPAMSRHNSGSSPGDAEADPGARTDNQAIGIAASVASRPPISARDRVCRQARPRGRLVARRQLPPIMSQRPSVASGTPSASTVAAMGINRQGSVACPRRSRVGHSCSPGADARISLRPAGPFFPGPAAPGSTRPALLQSCSRPAR